MAAIRFGSAVDEKEGNLRLQAAPQSTKSATNWEILVWKEWVTARSVKEAQGHRKRSGWSGLGRTNFRSLVSVAICDCDIGGCGNMVSARATCASVQCANPEQLQNVKQLQQPS